MKKLLALFLAMLMLLPLAGCGVPTGGRHPELFVVATHSLLGVLGRDRENTIILEEDDFGRVMFAYGGHTITSSRRGATFNILAVLIAQRTTRTHSYFYSGINVILTEIEGDWWPNAREFLDEEFIMEHFSGEQLEQLKVENDWNEELNEDRFFRVSISARFKRRYITTVSEEAQREAAEEAFEETLGEATLGSVFLLRSNIPLTMDQDGRVLFLLRSDRTFLLMFDSDGALIEETGIMELPDENLWDYRDQLREFKAANGWAFFYREVEGE
ncbi:MAG: hypothetical protein FWD99_09890 [Oscillospiraceae bacterium]|nr:hypothetical protein [Oscillospiraceae bacterium]